MLPLLHSNYKREEIITCKNEVVNWVRYSSVNVVFLLHKEHPQKILSCRLQHFHIN